MKRITLLLILSLAICLNSFAQLRTRVMSDGERRIFYTSVADAEKKLKQYYEERKLDAENGNGDYSETFPYEMFQDLIMHDERTLHHDFSFEGLDILSSHDKSIKVYYIPGVDELLLSCTINGGYSAAYFYDEAWESVNGELSRMLEVYSVKRGDGFLTFYVKSVYARWRAYESLYAYTMYKDGRIEKTFLFETDDGTFSECLNQIHSNMTGDGFLCYKTQFEINSREIFRPVLQDWAPSDATGKVERWVFNGSVFRYMGESYSGNETLCAKLRNYSANIAIINLKPWIIRVDLMPDGTYRYSSWKNKNMSQEPNIVIGGGISHVASDGEWLEYEQVYTDESQYSYIFRNGEYTYIVSYELYNVFSNGTYECSSPKLVVKHKDKVLMTLEGTVDDE